MVDATTGLKLHLAGFKRRIDEEMPNGDEADEAGERLKGRIIFRMADRIACSCVTCPKCGIWVVIPQNQLALSKEKSLAICPASECGKEFEFQAGETRVFEVPLPLFERRHFYRSELQESGI
jgi:hypothetical protein